MVITRFYIGISLTNRSREIRSYGFGEKDYNKKPVKRIPLYRIKTFF